MKKLFAVLFMSAVTFVAAAQQKQSPIANEAKAQTEKLNADVKLTDEQKVKVNEIFVQSLTEKQAILDAHKIDKDNVKKDIAIKKLKESTKEKMKAVLTAEQVATWEKKKAVREERKNLSK